MVEKKLDLTMMVPIIETKWALNENPSYTRGIECKLMCCANDDWAT